MDTILVVDDEPNLVLIVKRILEDEGFQVWSAPDGKEAQEFILSGKEQISTIVLDWSMPKMTGIELLKWIKDQPEFEHIPVVMQTALSTPSHIKQGIEAGAFYYLTKPTHREVLKVIVKAAVADYNQTRTLLKKVKESENPFRFLLEGTFRFRTIEEGEYLALRLANASPNPDSIIGLSELFINAVEHGNLGITYDEKTELVERGTWKNEIERRLKLPENRNKTVTVTVTNSGDLLSLTIEDQGRGFDYERFLTLDEKRVFDNHGRGIAIANYSLSLRYEGNGNRVYASIEPPKRKRR
ncbi:MAG TPA: response regulator [Bacteroidota bacterium]|nr:response regulator [Bacteroidota bacterium]